MKLGTSRRGTLLPALVAFLVLATVGAALAGGGGFTSPKDAEVSVRDDPRAGHRDDEGPGGETGSPDTGGDTGDAGTGASGDDACADAIDDGGAAVEVARGLDRAIEAIVENCARGQAQGLLNALARLQRNQERQEAKEHGTDPGDHGSGPNEHANDNANGPGDHPNPPGAEAEDHGRPDEPGRSEEHANEHASSGGSTSH